jgi:serine/threonine protein phosphatase PrpC
MGAWTELVDYTVPSNTTSVVLNTFGTITKDDFIKVVATFVNASSSSNELSLFANTATTQSNYYWQVLQGIGTSLSAFRANANLYTAIAGSSTTYALTYLKLSENDRFNIFTNSFDSLDSNLRTQFFYNTSSGATFSSGITTLTFTSNQTNGIGTGSRIQIYRLDAEKVADITTTANATQVDISSLSIGKDSEYLLVTDGLNSNTVSTIALSIFPNDLTTEANYYNQFILGDGSTSAAGRGNQARYIAVLPSQRSVGYTHIKLSEIGAYTVQSYNLLTIGTTTPQVQNRFVSSTAENITSITKLNIVANETNAIGSGTRFILYKLK